MKKLNRCLFAAGLLSVTGVARAADANATLTLNLPALQYANVSTTVKPDGTGAKSTTVKESKLNTADVAAAYAEITHGNFNLYFYPWSGSKTFQGSLMVVPDFVEVGLTLGLNSSTVDKPVKGSTNDTTVGLFAWLYPKVGTMTAEVGLELDSISGKSSTDPVAPATTTTKTDQSAFKVALAANIVVPLAKNFNYVGGLAYANTMTTVKEATATMPKGKATAGEFDVNIAAFRVTVE